MLLAVVAAQLMAELRMYGIALLANRLNAAKDAFFFSFTGSIVYGHGKPANVNKATRTVVALLCDTLFLYVARCGV